MYPREELTVLAARKAILRVRIARQRADCAEGFAQLTRPVGWFDRIHGHWKALPAWVKAGLPLLGFVLKYRRRRRSRGKLRVVRSLLRWAPVGWKLWQGLRAGRPL